MIQIVCIIWGTKYTNEYVDKLYNSIKRNTNHPFQFTCFVDSMQRPLHPEIIKKPIPFFTGDWFSKIGLYNEELYNPEDQVFYFDLDTVIIRNIDDILSYLGNFIILQDFYRRDGYGSGLMSWRPHAVNHMWKNYTRGYRARHGDQGWCEEQYPNADLWQQLYPEKIISYKVHIANNGRLLRQGYTHNPGNLNTASIVCFHGKPNPHEILAQQWVRENWT